ncbi:transcription termination factor Rho [Blautia sp. Sow4_E7]|uniref:transcription termination factor Rho n=1 Tax=Blautia sp. Sow4_E7 TaxID=3438749 RepID=UPI003F911523
MREKYESLPLVELKGIAKARGLKGISTMRKPELIERMLEEDKKEAAANEPAAAPKQENTAAPVKAESTAAPERTETERKEAPVRSRTIVRRNPEFRSNNYSRNDNAGRQGGYNGYNGEGRQGGYVKREQPATKPVEVVPPAEIKSEEPEQPRTVNEDQAEVLSNTYQISAETVQLDSGEKANGILEVMPDGFGFIRSENYLPGENDIYVSPSQIRRFNLKTGDIIQGNIRIKTQGEKFSALLYVTSINGFHPSEGQKRYNFENMTPIFPNERLIMERPGGTTAMRIVDLISPIGKGQRGMIVSPPKAGKTTLLKDVAKSILKNNKDMHLIILLIDERPEEVTDIKEAIQGPNVEVIYSTFDELPEHHKRVSEMVVERARRLVEHKQDVVILLDSITRLARAYNLVVPPSGRTLSGGLDPGALHMPKRFFGAARNMREGGSLTILATALVDTGSKMDDVIYEEFKGTGNMELVLDRKLQEKRVFPAIDIQKSGTRREDLLLSKDEQEAVYIMRKALNGMKSDEAVEQILNMFSHTANNAEFVQTVKKQKL